MAEVVWTEESWTRTARVYLKAQKELLRIGKAFECACCLAIKKPDEAAGAWNYEPEDPEMRKRMVGPGVYALCKQCIEEIRPETRQQKVTETMAKRGQFKMDVAP